MGKVWLTLLLCAFSIQSQASARLFIAVASNFEPTARVLAEAFHQQHPDIEVVLSSASSGTHYQQIVRGAPYGIFLSADKRYPQTLVDEGIAGDTHVYARGTLVLASKKPFEYPQAMQAIATGNARLAIANPRTAPYGLAAQQVLASTGIAAVTIQGQNVGQALNFVSSGAVDFAFAALSQVLHRDDFYWQLAPKVYAPIEQAGILLTTQDPNASIFWQYLASAEAIAIIKAHGYEEVPRG